MNKTLLCISVIILCSAVFLLTETLTETSKKSLLAQIVMLTWPGANGHECAVSVNNTVLSGGKPTFYDDQGLHGVSGGSANGLTDGSKSNSWGACPYTKDYQQDPFVAIDLESSHYICAIRLRAAAAYTLWWAKNAILAVSDNKYTTHNGLRHAINTGHASICTTLGSSGYNQAYQWQTENCASSVYGRYVYLQHCNGPQTQVALCDMEVMGCNENEMNMNCTPASVPRGGMVCGTTLIPPHVPGGGGDPHFVSWKGEHYDFHGVCDLVLLQNPNFNNGIGMDIHIRTKKTFQWSHISNAVLHIGPDSLEVTGGRGNKYWINGVAGDEKLDETSMLSNLIYGYPVVYTHVNHQEHKFDVYLSGEQRIEFKVWKTFVRVNIHNANAIDFNGSLGMLGSFEEGKKMARDKVTVIDDINEFGQEWQVLATEPNLFHDIEGPQFTKCYIPSAKDTRRRLSESKISQEEAELVCSHVQKANDHDMCVFDVMATNDSEVAAAY